MVACESWYIDRFKLCMNSMSIFQWPNAEQWKTDGHWSISLQVSNIFSLYLQIFLSMLISWCHIFSSLFNTYNHFGSYGSFKWTQFSLTYRWCHGACQDNFYSIFNWFANIFKQVHNFPFLMMVHVDMRCRLNVLSLRDSDITGSVIALAITTKYHTLTSLNKRY